MSLRADDKVLLKAPQHVTAVSPAGCITSMSLGKWTRDSYWSLRRALLSLDELLVLQPKTFGPWSRTAGAPNGLKAQNPHDQGA